MISKPIQLPATAHGYKLVIGIAATILASAASAGCTDHTTTPIEPPPTETDFPSEVKVDGDLVVANGALHLVSISSSTQVPYIDWVSKNGQWQTGIDTSNPGAPRDFVLAAKSNWPAPGQTDDVVYLSHNGATAPTVGIGTTPPDTTHRLQVSAQDSEPGMGTLLLRRTPQQTGNMITAIDPGGIQRLWVDADFWFKGASPSTGASLSIKADDQNGRPLVMAQADGTGVFGFQYSTDGSGSLLLRYLTGGVDLMALTTNGTPAFPSGLTTATLRVETPVVPATSTTACTQGDIAYDPGFVYVCVSANTWKRSALASW